MDLNRLRINAVAIQMENKLTASSSEIQNQEKLQNELTIVYKRLAARDNFIINLRITKQMLCNRIDMPLLPKSQNTSSNQPEECEATRDGDDSDDYGLS